MDTYKKLKLISIADEHRVCTWLQSEVAGVWICIGEGKTEKSALKHTVRNLERYLTTAKNTLDRL